MLLPRTVPLNWYRFDVIPSIELLKIFINNVENQVKSSIRDYNDQKETLILDEDPEEYYEREVDYHKGLDSETYDLDEMFKIYFPTLQRSSAVLSLCGFFEHEFDKLCVLYKNTENFNIDLKDLNGQGIERSMKYLKIVAMLPINKDSENWQKVKAIQKTRNLIAHNNGRLKDINGELHRDLQSILGQKEFLSGEYEINIKEGYLNFVLKSFNELFQHIDEVIQNKNRISNLND
jgi:hypothetical protein